MELRDINISERMEHYNVSGLSIAFIENGAIHMTKEFGVMKAGTNRRVNNHSIFNACSISKFLTAMLVLKLTDQGIFHLDEDINNRLTSWKVPENEYTQNNKVTLRTLLSHQSGIIDPEGSFCEYNSTLGEPAMVELLEGKTPYCKERIEVQYEPESDFQYSDAGFCIIQQVIEDVCDKSFVELMDEQIFEPLHMKNSTYKQTTLTGNNIQFSCGHNKKGEVVSSEYPIYPYPAAAGLWTTPTDLAILVIEVVNSLKGKSKIGLSESKAKELISSQGCKEWAGLGVFLDGIGQEIEFSSLGWGIGFQCMIVAYPYLETGVVIMTNTDLGVHQMEGIIGEILK
ncbi:CubicO group peptidase, beta-lactamase class C family [Bacillus sp. 491mf]|uniref:serine hydrolase domain-containing protein n=1 Tax=Bacillus TaxID=1386 RepID=UPI0008EED795|nr:serine hydrolase domain-containing protein [Bacillus sp. 491mf]SFC04498.1 CubicO group peptidase, beta-lactamase class C family [Bacillus sp. 491mf]